MFYFDCSNLLNLRKTEYCVAHCAAWKCLKVSPYNIFCHIVHPYAQVTGTPRFRTTALINITDIVAAVPDNSAVFSVFEQVVLSVHKPVQQRSRLAVLHRITGPRRFWRARLLLIFKLGLGVLSNIYV